MITINFSHYYYKFPRDFHLSKLLDVWPARLEDLSEDFLKYDTAYSGKTDVEYYPLPKKGNYMILVLQAGEGKGRLWTTIRSQRGMFGKDKLAYYRSHIGESVRCEVTK